MIIDFNTRKEIKEDAIITVSQTLTKNKSTGNFLKEDYSFEEATKSSEILPPNILIKNFEAVLSIMKEEKSLSPEHIDFLIEQCQNWEVSDQFALIE